MFTRFDSRWARVVPALALVLAFGQAAGLRARQAPTGKDVIARHVAAMGGEAAYKALKSIHAVGTFAMPAQGISGDRRVLHGASEQAAHEDLAAEHRQNR